MCPEKDEISPLSAERAVFYSKQNPKGLLKEIKGIAEESGGKEKEAYIAKVYLNETLDEILEDGTTPVSDVLQHISSGENVVIEVYVVSRKGILFNGKTLYYINFDAGYIFYGVSIGGTLFRITVRNTGRYLVDWLRYSLQYSGTDENTPLVLYFEGEGRGYGTFEAYKVCEISENTSSLNANNLYYGWAMKVPIILYRRTSSGFKMLELCEALTNGAGVEGEHAITFVEKNYNNGSISYTKYQIVGTTVTQIS